MVDVKRLGGLAAISLLLAQASAQTTMLVSRDSAGNLANGISLQVGLSGDGRYVVFCSQSTNLVPGDTNNIPDVFVRDRVTATTQRASVTTGGGEGDGPSSSPAISADGRYVAFFSVATNLVTGDTNAAGDIFVRDRLTGTTERVSLATGGGESNGQTDSPAISADGRYVAFAGIASNLVVGDTNGTADIFVRDRLNGTTERVSVDNGGIQGNGSCGLPAVSSSGRYIAYLSLASNLVPGDTNGTNDIFLRDRQQSVTERVSLTAASAQSNNGSGNSSVSSDGRYVAFDSFASNLVAGDTNGSLDVFVRDRVNATTERVSVDTAGIEGNDLSTTPSMSFDGRRVAFLSQASNLVAADTNASLDIFVRDRQSGTTLRASVKAGGAEANWNSAYPEIAAEGRFVAFESDATDLVPGDTNTATDVFVHDLDPTGFTSLCEPGTGGVIPCPCANPPSGSGSGCDNSSGSGGAVLTASGEAYLSADTLVFTTSGERPTATSIVLQGTAAASAGIVYGQGVRCVAGSLKRLYAKSAFSGSITAPDWTLFDPPVSARSAAKGDVIQAGQSRWYLVFYRDPIVLGGCPASSTFNATQTGRVAWWM